MFPFRTEREDRPWLTGFAILAVVEYLLLACVSWSQAGGHFMLPLDDSYIHLQYARRIAAEGALTYGPGMLPSGGMTSPLYVLLLVPMFLAKLGGVKGALGAYALGGLLWALLPVWVYQLTRRLTNGLCASLAALLVLANGHLLWNFASGMETGLFTLLLVGALLGVQAWWQGELVAARITALACLALLPLTRPEGVVISLVLAAIVLLRRGAQPRVSLLAIILGLVPFALWLALLKNVTGDWRPAGLVVKGLSANPYMSGADKFAKAAETLSAIGGRFYANQIPDDAYAAFKGTSTLPYVPVLLAALALFGGAWLTISEWRARKPAAGAFLFAAWLLGLASLAASALPFIHQQRYLAPYTPLAIVLGVCGVRRIAQLFQQHEETALKSAGAVLLIASLPSVPFWMAEHGRNARDIYGLLRVASFSLEGETRPIAVTDAGVLAYYTNAPAWDLVGLCSQEFTRAMGHGEGSTLEALSRLPQQLRPREYVGYREWFSHKFPLGEATMSVGIPRTSITSGIRVGRFPIDWQAINRMEEVKLRRFGAPSGRTISDVDVADLGSERANGYHFTIEAQDYRLGEWPIGVCPTVRVEDDATTSGLTAVDGARFVRGEEWNLAIAAPKDHRTVLHGLVGSDAATSATLRISVVSNTTGYAATRAMKLPRRKPGAVGHLELDLTDAINEAGGTAWRIRVSGENPADRWLSAQWWITSELHGH